MISQILRKSNSCSDNASGDTLRSDLRKLTDLPFTVDDLPGGDVAVSSDEEHVLILGRLAW
jgi:hypothetical protein